MLRVKPIRLSSLLLLPLLLLLFSGGCEYFLQLGKEFKVKVLSLFPFGYPVSGATIEGGVDWEYFNVQTDRRGVAVLPKYARGWVALIYRNNYFPLRVESLSPRTYFVKQTPKEFRPVGEVKGWSIRFDEEMLITVDYQGGYHVYSYYDYGITELATAQLPAKAIRETQLHGDTLWFSTHSDGIYVYSLQNPYNPLQLFHLAIPGYLSSFALKDGMVIVGNTGENDPVRVYTYDMNGQCEEIAQFGYYYVRKIELRGDYLILLNGWNCQPVVYNVSDPANPYLVYDSGVVEEYVGGFLYGNYLILTPRTRGIHVEFPVNHKIIDLSDPASPVTAGFLPADSELLEFIDDNTAVGRYYLWSGTPLYGGAFTVLKGNMSDGFHTVGVITENTFAQSFMHEVEGYFPPYFIIGEKLWKLVD